MRDRFFQKARHVWVNISGETLVESLVAVLIVAAAMLMLTTAIVSAAKINVKAGDNVATADETNAADAAVEISFNGSSISSGDSVADGAKLQGKSYTIQDGDNEDIHTYYYFDIETSN